MGTDSVETEDDALRLANEIASDRYLGRLYRLHPEHAPGNIALPRAPEETAGEIKVVPLPTPEVIEHVIARRRFTVTDIVRECGLFYSASPKEIYGESRMVCIVKARQIAMYLAHKLTGLSLAKIGKEFGRDHTTILHAVRKLTPEVERKSRIGDEIDVLTLRLAGLYARDAA